MKVTLIDYQNDALELLIYTKSTRLRQEVTLDDIKGWAHDQKVDHLDYMKKTIQSSFEFVRYVFNIEGVSRNFTHQLVRTRKASYAQESQRTVDVRDADVIGLPALEDAHGLSEMSLKLYGEMIDMGFPVQECRSVLPTGIETSIIMAVDLRELMHMGEVRLCTRTQGEYQEVFKAMRDEILTVHPWFEGLIEVYCVKTGICCFPNYTKCPIQEHTVQVTDEHKRFIKDKWTISDHIANPIATDGKTM